VYKVRLSRVHWYSDRAALDISLGDLMLLVLLKAAFRNATAAQDEYVHTNALSTMVNLAPHAVRLSSVVTTRLCSCIDASHKRLLWLDQKVYRPRPEIVTAWIQHAQPYEVVCRTSRACKRFVTH
jgi:hypothetical protein